MQKKQKNISYDNNQKKKFKEKTVENNGQMGNQNDSNIHVVYENKLNNEQLQIRAPIRFTSLFRQIMPQQFSDQYELIRELGRGSYGYVYQVKNYKTGQIRAIKIMKLSNQQSFQEIEILKNLKHQNVVFPIEFCIIEEYVYIVTEFCSGNTLYNKILQSNNFSEEICRDYIRQILQGLNYCHKKNIAHRDLKPDNLLFDVEGEDQILKIIDFGLSANFGNSQLTLKCGTSYYVAPEIFRDDFYNEKVDIWSVGIIMYILITGSPPIDGADTQQIINNIKKLKQIDFSPLQDKLSIYGIDFIQKMLQIDSKKRSSAEDLLKHCWMQNSIKNNFDKPQINKTLKGLRNFTSHQYLQNLIYFYTTNSLMDAEEKKKLTSVFTELDQDTDGMLNYSELISAFQKSGRSYERSKQIVDKVLKELNLNKEEGISLNDFFIVCCNKQKMINDVFLKNGFEQWDLENKGYIDIEDIKSILSQGYFSANPDIQIFVENQLENLELEDDKIYFEDFQSLLQTFVEDENISQSLTFNQINNEYSMSNYCFHSSIRMPDQYLLQNQLFNTLNISIDPLSSEINTYYPSFKTNISVIVLFCVFLIFFPDLKNGRSKKYISPFYVQSIMQSQNFSFFIIAQFFNLMFLLFKISYQAINCPDKLKDQIIFLSSTIEFTTTQLTYPKLSFAKLKTYLDFMFISFGYILEDKKNKFLFKSPIYLTKISSFFEIITTK